MAPATQALPLACLMLLLLRRAPGVGAWKTWGFRLQQPQNKVSVTARETLTLTCTTSGAGPLGPVKWLKGWGSENKTIYEQWSSFPRVMRVVNGSNMDFSIFIRDVQPEDAGTYYCVKFSKTLNRGLEIVEHGNGTEVSVLGLGVGAEKTWSFRLQQPQNKVSVTVGGTLTLTCTASGAGPLGPVKWLKGWGSENKTIYDQTGSFPRVMRVVNDSNMDFSIFIRDVQPEDAGTYYCVKFSKSLKHGLEIVEHGNGTEVSVLGLDVNLLSSPILWLGILLEKGLLGGLLVFLFKRMRA